MMEEKLKKLKLEAMKVKDELAKNLYGVALGEIQLAQSNKDLTEDEKVKIVQKVRGVCHNNATKYGDEDGYKEAELLDAILPKMLSREELVDAVIVIIGLGKLEGMTDNVGRCTGAVNKILKGQGLHFNGGDVKSILDGLL